MGLRHILGVLDGDEAVLWKTFDRAVLVAEAGRARLTLVKSIDRGWLMQWFVSAALEGPAVSMPYLDFETIAAHQLARVAEFVPSSIPLTTRLLGWRTGPALCELIRTGRFDAFVATDRLLARNGRVVRELSRFGVQTVTVSSRPELSLRPPDRPVPPIHQEVGA